MANLSDAWIRFRVDKVAPEFIDYINVVNEVAGYNIADDQSFFHGSEIEELIEVDGSAEFESSATGRWSYKNNVDSFLSDDEDAVKKWLGVGADYSYLPEEKREENRVRADKCYQMYKRLIKAIKNTGGSVELKYVDSDLAMDTVGEGYAELHRRDKKDEEGNAVAGDVFLFSHFESEEATPERYAELFGVSLETAEEMFATDEE